MYRKKKCFDPRQMILSLTGTFPTPHLIVHVPNISFTFIRRSSCSSYFIRKVDGMEQDDEKRQLRKSKTIVKQ